MQKGCWLIVDGKKVAAVRGKDGVAVPVKEEKKPVSKAKE